MIRPTIARQRWLDLLFLHWVVPVEALRPLVPEPLSIDLHEGRAYVGIIPFDSTGLRPPGLPEWLGIDFLETNVRTYVRREGGGLDNATDSSPGVYFFSLDAASRLGAIGGRTGFGLPYFHATMEMTRSGREVSYRMRRSPPGGAALWVRYEIEGSPAVSPPGSLQHFLIERYRFRVRRGGTLQTVQVRHASYPVQKARVLELEESLLAAAGVSAPTSEPLAHYSPGVDVHILAPAFGR